VGGNAVVVTDGQGRRVDEGHPGAAPFAGGEIATQGDTRAWEKFDKTMRAHELGAIGAQRHRDVLRVVMLAGPVMTPGKIDQERQPLTQCQRRRACALTRTDGQPAAALARLETLTELINIADDNHQLVHRGSQRRRGGFVAESVQYTGASCFFQTHPYPELTL
jgi:hypothetical protein